MESSSTVTVIITCFNEERFIVEALESVVDQTEYSAIDKIIVIDDGSVDGSVACLEEFQKQCPKLHILHTPNVGLPAARNTGISTVESEWFALLDGDDIWLPGKIQEQLKYTTLGNDLALIYTDYFTFGAEELACRSNDYRYGDADILKRFFLADGPIMPSSVLLRTSAVQAVGCFDETLKRGQDTDLWLRLAARYYFHHVPMCLIERRVHRSSLGSNHEAKLEALKVVVRKACRLYPELEPLRRTKIALTLARMSRAYLIDETDDSVARERALEALRLAPSNFEVLGTVLSALSPRGYRGLRRLRNGFRRAR